jgi:hypothetical protein
VWRPRGWSHQVGGLVLAAVLCVSHGIKSVQVAGHLPNKIPKWFSGDPPRMVGDAIYDFSTDPSGVRKSVHNESHRDHDLGGQYALLSEHFYYFGDRP